jgi:hypothetical protein
LPTVHNIIIINIIIVYCALFTYQHYGHKKNGSIQKKEQYSQGKCMISRLSSQDFQDPQEKERGMNLHVHAPPGTRMQGTKAMLVILIFIIIRSIRS